MVVFHVFENSDPSREIYLDFSVVTTVNEGSTQILLASLFMGSAMIEGMTASRQSKNTMAKEILDWQPTFSTYRQGLPSVLKDML